MQSLAPSAPNRRAVARPIPLAPPVMTATLPSNCKGVPPTVSTGLVSLHVRLPGAETRASLTRCHFGAENRMQLQVGGLVAGRRPASQGFRHRPDMGWGDSAASPDVS